MPRLAALPPDVRQGYALPMSAPFDVAAMPRGSLGEAPGLIIRIAERHSLSAHQAAKPRTQMIEIVNRQRGRKLNPTQWQEFAEKALAAITKDKKTATLVFVSDYAIKDLNRRFRGRNYATDVLSFPSEAERFEDQTNLGEVVISVQRAATQAKDHGLSFSVEAKQLILHGLLHLSGYDHETDKGKMNRLELRLRKQLGIDV